ncbi:hypothetical protein SHAM105786_09350 [Shewanella amazonensis]
MFLIVSTPANSQSNLPDFNIQKCALPPELTASCITHGRNIEVPTAPNQRWSMDFMSDQLSNGRRFRVLNVIDDYLREMVGQLVSVAISGRQVSRFLDQLRKSEANPTR